MYLKSTKEPRTIFSTADVLAKMSDGTIKEVTTMIEAQGCPYWDSYGVAGSEFIDYEVTSDITARYPEEYTVDGVENETDVIISQVMEINNFHNEWEEE